MLLLACESFLSGQFDRLGYLAPFIVLLAAGAGFPVPEEVTMLGSGFLLHQGRVEFVWIVATCITATLLGDSIPFWLGRRFGADAMAHPRITRIFHAERRALLDDRFRRHGNWGVFTCRFLPGVRLPGFFTAGTLGMSYPRFLLVDGLGALIMTPTWILIGKTFGAKIARLEDDVQHLNQILGFTLLAILIGLGVHFLVIKRDKQLEKLEGPERAAAGPEAPVAPPDAAPPPDTAAASGTGAEPGSPEHPRH